MVKFLGAGHVYFIILRRENSFEFAKCEFFCLSERVEASGVNLDL